MLKEGTTSDGNIGRHSSQMHSIGCLPFIDQTEGVEVSVAVRFSDRGRLRIRIDDSDRVALKSALVLRLDEFSVLTQQILVHRHFHCTAFLLFDLLINIQKGRTYYIKYRYDNNSR